MLPNFAIKINELCQKIKNLNTKVTRLGNRVPVSALINFTNEGGGTFNFNALQSTGTGTLKYFWDITGSGVFIEGLPSQTLTTASLIFVRLRVTDALGHIDETGVLFSTIV